MLMRTECLDFLLRMLKELPPTFPRAHYIRLIYCIFSYGVSLEDENMYFSNLNDANGDLQIDMVQEAIRLLQE